VTGGDNPSRSQANCGSVVVITPRNGDHRRRWTAKGPAWRRTGARVRLSRMGCMYQQHTVCLRRPFAVTACDRGHRGRGLKVKVVAENPLKDRAVVPDSDVGTIGVMWWPSPNMHATPYLRRAFKNARTQVEKRVSTRCAEQANPDPGGPAGPPDGADRRPDPRGPLLGIVRVDREYRMQRLGRRSASQKQA